MIATIGYQKRTCDEREVPGKLVHRRCLDRLNNYQRCVYNGYQLNQPVPSYEVDHVHQSNNCYYRVSLCALSIAKQ